MELLKRRLPWSPARQRGTGEVTATESAASYPIVAALAAAETFLGPDRVWASRDDEQERFLTEFFAPGRGEVPRIPEIESLASWNAVALNDFLAAKGFPSFFTPFEERRFGVASVLDLLVEWAQEGTVTELTTPDGRTFPAVKIWEDAVSFFRARGHRHPIARLETKSGDRVWMTILDQPPAGFGLLSGALELSRPRKEIHDFAALVFPMVGLQQEIGLGWVVGLQTEDAEGRQWEIETGLQRNRLRMNEFGARAESAVMLQPVAVGIGSKPKPEYVIDRPFLVWFERKAREAALRRLRHRGRLAESWRALTR